MRAIRIPLFRPLFAEYVSDDPVRRSAATGILLDYSAKDPAHLSELVLNSSVEQFQVVFPLLTPHKQLLTEHLSAALVQPLTAFEDSADKTAQAKRHANAAACLAKLGQAGLIWPVFEWHSDPRSRSWSIERMHEFSVDPQILIDRFLIETDGGIRRALMLALGNYSGNDVNPTQRTRVVRKCVSLFEKDPHAGTHSAAEWLLRQWDSLEELSQSASGDNSLIPPDGFQWFDGPKEHSFAVVDAQDADDVGYRYAIALRETSVKQFLEYQPNRKYHRKFSSQPQCPIGQVNWFEALQYCHWLNVQAKVPSGEWCFSIDDVMNQKVDLKIDVTKTGFRLPTNAECRVAYLAGATTRRNYGDDDQLLDAYAWHGNNTPVYTSFPTGLKKPNDFGLFDFHGNINEWRMSSPSDKAPGAKIGGGSSGTWAETTHARDGAHSVPQTRFKSYGFRIVRTLPTP